MTEILKFLAFETSTEMMSVAVSRGTQTWHHHGMGGPNASAQLIPVIQELLSQAELTLNDLTAVVIGHGPGSFTGLRTACSVAQGLAMGANLKVIQIDTMMVVAEDARMQLYLARTVQPPTQQIGVLMDARMSEVYAGAYEWQSESSEWHSVLPLQVGPPEMMLKALNSVSKPCDAWAGNGWDVYKDRLSLTSDTNAHPDANTNTNTNTNANGNLPAMCVSAMPHALALLRLAPAQWVRGKAVAPEAVQPLYIRDKVAQTTAEREAIKASKMLV
jgi:tRNA threonylcarbamoyladenosine biosynthesis protein TsaB